MHGHWIIIPRTDRARVRLKRFLDGNKIKYFKLVDGLYYFVNIKEDEIKLREYIKKQFKNFKHESKAKVGSHIQHDMWLFKVEQISTEFEFDILLKENGGVKG